MLEGTGVDSDRNCACWQEKEFQCETAAEAMHFNLEGGVEFLEFAEAMNVIILRMSSV